jgi:hypothetical protein
MAVCCRLNRMRVGGGLQMGLVNVWENSGMMN